MSQPTGELHSRYHGYSLDELRRAYDEQSEPRGDYMNADEEREHYQAWRARQALIHCLDALEGNVIRPTRGYLDYERYDAPKVIAAFRSIITDHDAERPL